MIKIQLERKKQLLPMKKQLINKELALIFTGLSIVIFIIWNRLIRIRIPKDLPFIITDLTFITLFGICLIFFITLIISIKSYYNTDNHKVSLFSNLSGFIAQSLQELDFKVRNYDFIWYKIYNICIAIAKYSYKYLHLSKYIYVLFHLPKIVLPIILFIEIFYFHKIALFYTLLVLLLLPLIYRYIYHSVHNVYTIELNASDQRLVIKVQKLVNNELIFCTLSPYPTHYYIQEITLERLKIRDNDHVFQITLSDIYMDENPNVDWQKAFQHFENSFSFYSKFYEVLSCYYQIKKTLDPVINIFMLSTYLICWSYILCSGHYILSQEFISYIEAIKCNIEPFSGLTITYTNETNEETLL